jgi:hypothetical protein
MRESVMDGSIVTDDCFFSGTKHSGTNDLYISTQNSEYRMSFLLATPKILF